MPVAKGQSTKQGHEPQRSCVGCGKVRPKREMLRLVRMAEGKVAVDHSSRKAGRGAYLCPAPECWALALRKDKIGRALRAKLSPSDTEALNVVKLSLESKPAADGGHSQ